MNVHASIDPWRLLGWILDFVAVCAITFSVFLHTRIASLELWREGVVAVNWTQQHQTQYQAAITAQFDSVWRAIHTQQLQTVKDIGEIKQLLYSMHSSDKDRKGAGE